jgi:ABC-type antimicrobial peptide transport system permease subunit
MVALTISYCLVSMVNELYSNNIGYRTLNVILNSDDDLEKIKNIDHVKNVVDFYYNNPNDADVSEFDTDLTGYITFYPVIDDDYLVISAGKNISNDDEIVCSDYFYPYKAEQVNGKTIFNSKRILKPKDFIGKEFSLELEDDNGIGNFKIVGAFDSSKISTDLSACFVTMNRFSKMVNIYQNGGSGYYDEELGEIVFIPDEYPSLDKVVVVDSYKNVDEVITKLNNMDIVAVKYKEIATGYVQLLISVPFFLSLVLLFIFVIILESFLNKKIKYDSKNYAILKSVGYTRKQIVNIDILGNSLIYLFSVIISIIIYVILFIYLRNNMFSELIYDGVIFKLSLIPIVVSILIIYFVIFIVNKKVLKNKLERSINGILK